ncbi:MAG TPA: PQQ-dependent sugar dehydrogenase, partial [Urbifossiella sp.]
MRRIFLFAIIGPFALACLLAVRFTEAADHPIPPPLRKAPPSAFECRFTDTPIVIDGAAEDAAWKNAHVIEAFHLPWLGDKARMSRTNTKARLLWDREFLYFFADMEDSDLFADVKEHDGNTWNNDVFELFFHPDRNKPGYYEFQVNAAGATFDCFMPKRDFTSFDKQKKLGDFHIEAKLKLRGTLNKRDDADQGWSVEGRIPWTDFLRTGGRPEPGELWGMNLCRYDYHKDWKEPELSCIAPIARPKVGSFFHQHEDYATVEFVGPGAKAGEKRERAVASSVVGFPDPPPPYRVVRAIPEYRPDFPIMMKQIPGSDRLLVLTQPQAYASTKLETIADPTAHHGEKPRGSLVPIPALNTPGGGTAYDFVFHPKFADNGFIYIGWNGYRSWLEPRKRCFVTRYTMQTKPPYAIDPNSAVHIISWESNGHNGCAVTFGLDGMLYLTSGDGTSDSDTNLTGQRTDLLLAKVLRIDVDHPAGNQRYSVPKDNPFVNDPRFAPETWAYGLRNPWRICTDTKTGHIWVGQNGQD